MKHCIISKFSDTVTDKAALIENIKALFAAEPKPDGVRGYEFITNCVDRPNRYDLMIAIDMPASALPVWDVSTLHKRWKDEFGEFLAAKAIFDYEP